MLCYVLHECLWQRSNPLVKNSLKISKKMHLIPIHEIATPFTHL